MMHADVAKVGSMIHRGKEYKKLMEEQKIRRLVTRRLSDHHKKIDADLIHKSLADDQVKELEISRRLRMRSYDKADLEKVRREGKLNVSSNLNYSRRDSCNEKAEFAGKRGLTAVKRGGLADVLADIVMNEEDPRLKLWTNNLELSEMTEKHKLLKLPAFLNSETKEYKRDRYEILKPRLYGRWPDSEESSNLLPQLNFDDLGQILKANNFPNLNSTQADKSSHADYWKALQKSLPDIKDLLIDQTTSKSVGKGKTNSMRSNISVLANWYSSKLNILSKTSGSLKSHSDLWSFTFREIIKLCASDQVEKSGLLLLLYLHCLRIVESRSRFCDVLLELTEAKLANESAKNIELKEEINAMLESQKKVLQSRKNKFVQTDNAFEGHPSKIHSLSVEAKYNLQFHDKPLNKLQFMADDCSPKSYAFPLKADFLVEDHYQSVKSERHIPAFHVETHQKIQAARKSNFYEQEPDPSRSPMTPFNFDPLKKSVWGVRETQEPVSQMSNSNRLSAADNKSRVSYKNMGE